MTLQKRSLAVRTFGLALRLSNKLAALPNRLVPPPFRLIQIGSSFWQARALYVAARLDLATALADRVLSAPDLAAEVGANADALGRLLRMLAAMGVFEETSPGRWRNNALSAPLRRDRSDNVRAMVLMHNSPEMSRPWFETLEQGIRTGDVPFELSHGEEFYAYMDRHPDFNRLFAEAMGRLEHVAGAAFATDFDWDRFDRVIDVGGAHGAKAVAILKRHPHMRAVVVDREAIIDDASRHWAGRDGAECLARIDFLAGDVLRSVPTGKDSRDIYLLSAVLHGFGDDACVKALSTVAAAARPVGAAIVLLEMVFPAFRADMTATAMDMQMLMATRGRERTEKEWRRLFDSAGVGLVETVGLTSIGQLLVLTPTP